MGLTPHTNVLAQNDLLCQCFFCQQGKEHLPTMTRVALRACEHCYCVEIPFASIEGWSAETPHVKCCNCGHQRVKEA